MGDHSQELVDALEAIEQIADDLTADEAIDELDDATLQVFWREWPRVSSWAGGLWRKLNTELAPGARPHSNDDDHDEIGGSE